MSKLCKSVSLLLAFLLVVNLFVLVKPFSTDVNAYSKNSYIMGKAGDSIYYDNSLTNYKNVYCYMWKEIDGEFYQENSTWPGKKMKNLGNDIFSYTLDSDYNWLIFNCGDAGGGLGQTDDLPYPGDNHLARGIYVNRFNGRVWDNLTIGIQWNDSYQFSNNASDNAITSLFEKSRQDCMKISMNLGVLKTLRVSFMTSLKEGLGTGLIAKEAGAKLGLNKSTEEDIIDEVTMDYISEYFGVHDPGSALETDKSLYKRVKKVLDFFSSLGKAARKKALNKSTIKKLSKQIDANNDEILNAYNKLDKAGTIAKWGVKSLEMFSMFVVLQQYNLDVIRQMKKNLAKSIVARSSQLYKGLKSIENAAKDPAKFISKMAADEAIINKIGDIENYVPNKKIAKAAKIIADAVCIYYDLKGGKYAQDYMKANISVGMAAALFYALGEQNDTPNLKMVFDLALIAHKHALKTAMSLEKKGTQKYKACSNDLNKLDVSGYDLFYNQCVNTNYENYTYNSRTKNKINISKNAFTKAATIDEIANNENEDFSYDDTIVVLNTYNEEEKTSIEDYEFSGLGDKKGIIIPDTVQYIGDSAFLECTNSKFVTFGSSLKDIADNAFKNCISLSEMDLPNSLSTIGNNSFENCVGLSSVEFGSNLKSIGSKAFSGCNSINSLFFYALDTEIAEDAFENCSSELIINGYKGSTAEKFAKDNNFVFNSLGKTAEKIEIVHEADKKVFNYGEDIDTTGLELQVSFSDGSIETIQNGWISYCNTFTKGIQQATITYENINITYDVKVLEKEEATLSIEENSIHLTKGDSMFLHVDSGEDDLYYYSNDPSIATVENGIITANNIGSTDVYVFDAYGNCVSCEVIVDNITREIINNDEYCYYVFAPNESGDYIVNVQSEADVFISIYSSEDILVDEQKQNRIVKNLSGGEDTSYVIEVGTNSENSVPVSVSIEKSEEKNWFVAGDEALCGSDWEAYDLNNRMNFENYGYYSKTYKYVSPGTYTFRVTNGSWNESYGDTSNTLKPYSFTIENDPMDVIVTFDSIEKTISISLRDNYYKLENGQTIDVNDTILRDSNDIVPFRIGNEFKNLQILGVQAKKNTTSRDVRFVSVINNDIVKDAEDYGYIAVGSNDMTSARSIVEGYTLDTVPAKNVFSCKGTSNKISGDYGKDGADTKYKYVTYSVKNIGDYSVAVMFYVKDKNGKVFYAPYTNSAGNEFNSCAVNWEALK